MPPISPISRDDHWLGPKHRQLVCNKLVLFLWTAPVQLWTELWTDPQLWTDPCPEFPEGKVWSTVEAAQSTADDLPRKLILPQMHTRARAEKEVHRAGVCLLFKTSCIAVHPLQP